MIDVLLAYVARTQQVLLVSARLHNLSFTVASTLYDICGL